VNRSRKHRAELDARERRILAIPTFKAKGRTRKEYAAEFGISYKTAKSDWGLFLERQQAVAQKMLEGSVGEEYIWIQELKDELTQVATPERRIELALAILDREMRLLGTAAPTRSVTAHVNTPDEVDPATLPEYRRWLYETRYMSAEQKEKAFQLIRASGLNAREAVTIEVPTSSPLWNEPKQLAEGGE
jgi:hypothetical protein